MNAINKINLDLKENVMNEYKVKYTEDINYQLLMKFYISLIRKSFL